ncbi:MAG: DNA polymerase III subunit gamma/tau [Ginsengibacter sp.]
MENFVVSARKYRPQNFNTVVGQAHITTTLKNAIKNNQLAHAFLFCGPRGVGKTTCARILAKTINCESKTPDGEACNVCNSCVSFDKGSSLNIHELDAASNNSVDDIRALVDQVRFAPQAGKYKVYIVDEVHMLSSSAFNAFLKTLEEPPPFAIFILATTEKHKILPTILSRCQIFDFKRITNQDTVEHLQEICDKESIKAEKTALHIIAQKSEGCLRDALSILDKIISFTNGELTYSNTLEHLNILDEDYYFKLVEAMQAQQLSDALLIYNEIDRKGFEGDLVLNGFAEFLRNLLVSQDAKVAMLLEVSEGFKKRYKTTSQALNSNWILSAMNIVNEVEISYRQAKNKRLHVEMALIKLCYLSQALDLINSDTGLSKKKQTDSVKPVSFKALTPIAIKEIAAPKKSSAVSTPSSLKSEIAPSALPEPPQAEAKLVIEKEIMKPVDVRAVADNTRVVKDKTKKHSRGSLSLEAIRERVARENQNNQIKDLTEEELTIAWGRYIDKLAGDKNHSAVSNFKSAKLKIIDNNTIEIVTDNPMQQKFIEVERGELITSLQMHFNNRFLTYSVEMIENEENIKPKDEHLSGRQQYFKIIESYPLVQELRERLGLQLDYI